MVVRVGLWRTLKVKVKVKSLSRVRLFATPWTVAHHAPPSMGFSRQEYWSRLPFPSPRTLSAEELMLLNCSVRRLLRVPWTEGDPTRAFQRRSVLGVYWKDWCWSWNSNTLATWCEELTHLKSPWCWERLRSGGEGDDKGWDGWMALPTLWTWVWVASGSWWWTGRPGMLRFMVLQGVRHDWVTELNWTKVLLYYFPQTLKNN